MFAMAMLRVLLWIPFIAFTALVLISVGYLAVAESWSERLGAAMPIAFLSMPWWLPFKNAGPALGDMKWLFNAGGLAINALLLFGLARIARRRAR